LSVGGEVTAPRVLQRVQPEFPDAARAEGITEARVILVGVVRTDGSIDVENVVRSPGFGMDEAAIEALRQWRFSPATRNGEPVDVRIHFEINFQRQDDQE
jgi:TonB family protein